MTQLAPKVNRVLGAQLRIVQDGGNNLIEVMITPQAGYIYLDAFGKIQRVGLSDGWRSQFGEKSPADLVCFLQNDNGKWYFPAQVDQNGICPWYVGE